jgi:DNA-binding MarR family transcriptional regulator
MAKNSTRMTPNRTGIETAERLRRAVGRLGRALRLTHVDGSLSPGQREVLATIVRRGPLRLSELAAEEGLNPTTLSRILSHLASAKLVTRRQDEVDARVVHLAATEAGLALQKEMRGERTDALFFALEKLTADQHRVVLEALPVLELLEDSLRKRNQ